MTNTTLATRAQKIISEDCLYINIFADSRCTSVNVDDFFNSCLQHDPCPVVYYIHGGAFFWGSAVQFTDEFIIERYASDRMVFLIPAYRLGVFGFWDLGDDRTVPRNLGLHGGSFFEINPMFSDMILSLEWVQKEISHFGGKPTDVTMMGNSAGASAIEFLSVSPSVPKHFYSKIILSSGTPIMFNGFNHSATNAVVEQSGV